MIFGEFIKKKRLESGLTQRNLSESMELSLSYLSDIENNRRYPMDNDKLEILADLLQLSQEDRENLYDLAGKARNEMPPDLLEYALDSEVSTYVRTALRKAKKNNISAVEWQKIIESLDGKK